MTSETRPWPGRPPATSHAAIETVAFELFARKGFDETTLDDIAAAVGVGRRTIFRYFPSKNDIPWGQFDASLVGFRATLDAMPRELPAVEAVQRAVIAFNRFDDAAIPQHRQRMKLILRTPTLQAHSVLRYGQWRAVIAEYVGARHDVPADSLLPRTIGQVALALALSAYEEWLSCDATPLPDLLGSVSGVLEQYVHAEI